MREAHYGWCDGQTIYPLLEIHRPMKELEAIRSRSGIVGRKVELITMINAMNKNKHVLLEGPVGAGKTKLALAVIEYLGRRVYRVDGDERYTESKLSGWFDPPTVFSKGYTWEAFIPGPLTMAMLEGGVLFINELNRMPEGTQNVLLPAMDERKIILPKLGEINAKEGFVVIATQNPGEFAGTSRVSEALRDRFIWIGIDYQSKEEELEIVLQEVPSTNRKIAELAVEVIRATRNHRDLRRGSSIRGAIDMALLLQDTEEVQEDLIRAAITALYNKIDLQLKSERKKEEVISEIVGMVLKGVSINKDFSERGEAKKEGNPWEGVYMGSQIAVKKNERICDSLSVMAQNNGLEQRKTVGITQDTNWTIIEKYLDEEDAPFKKELELLAIKAILSLASEISEKGMRKYRRQIRFFESPVFCEEIEDEETFENMCNNKIIDYRDIAVMNKCPRRLAVSLMLDASNSMEGEKIVIAALAVAALAYRLEKDHFSIIAFKDKAEIIKGIGEEIPIEEVITKILNYKYGDLTNIEDGLKKGLEQIEMIKLREDFSDVLGIIVTDGWVTAGGDPLGVAKEYEKLHVLQAGLGGYNTDSLKLSIEMAKAGRGVHIFIEDINELPHALMNLLRVN